MTRGERIEEAARSVLRSAAKFGNGGKSAPMWRAMRRLCKAVDAPPPTAPTPPKARCVCGHAHSGAPGCEPDSVCDEWGEEENECACTDFAPAPAETTAKKCEGPCCVWERRADGSDATNPEETNP